MKIILNRNKVKGTQKEVQVIWRLKQCSSQMLCVHPGVVWMPTFFSRAPAAKGRHAEPHTYRTHAFIFSCSPTSAAYGSLARTYKWRSPRKMCRSIKYPYLPHGRSLEIPTGKGVWTAKIYKGKYEAYLEIPGGREGSNQNTFRGGGMDIFWNHTMAAYDGHLAPSLVPPYAIIIG